MGKWLGNDFSVEFGTHEWNRVDMRVRPRSLGQVGEGGTCGGATTSGVNGTKSSIETSPDSHRRLGERDEKTAAKTGHWSQERGEFLRPAVPEVCSSP